MSSECEKGPCRRVGKSRRKSGAQDQFTSRSKYFKSDQTVNCLEARNGVPSENNIIKKTDICVNHKEEGDWFTNSFNNQHSSTEIFLQSNPPGSSVTCKQNLQCNCSSAGGDAGILCKHGHRKLNLNENSQCLKGENKLRPMPASKLLTDDMSLKEVIRNEDQEPTCTYETKYSKQVIYIKDYMFIYIYFYNFCR